MRSLLNVLYLLLAVSMCVGFSHPLFLGAVLLLNGLVLAAGGQGALFLRVTRWVAATGWIYSLVDVLFLHAGVTVLWKGPALPVVGQLQLTLEALGFAADMTVRMLAVGSCFVLFEASAHPDDLFDAFSRIARQSALVVFLAARALPFLASQGTLAAQLIRARGAHWDDGSLRQRWRSRALLLRPVFQAALEYAVDYAQALEMRGYHSENRTRYRTVPWGRREVIQLTLLLGSGASALYGMTTQVTTFGFFPRMDEWILDTYTWRTFAGVFAPLLGYFWVRLPRRDEEAVS